MWIGRRDSNIAAATAPSGLPGCSGTSWDTNFGTPATWTSEGSWIGLYDGIVRWQVNFWILMDRWA